MEKEKKLDSFNETQLQDLSVIRGGTTSETEGGALSASEMATVIFEEEGASITKPFGGTRYCATGGQEHRDVAIFWLIFALKDK